MIKIAQGAEAIIYKDNNDIIKERFSKKYRLAHLDESLRKFRTRREAKILGKLESLNFPAPKLKGFSDKRMSIVMDFVPGEKLKDIVDETNFELLAQQIGEQVNTLHNTDIIHGDLTTSNMIVNKEVNFIDFGLSFFSDKTEDKAVDLFLLDRALESTHFALYPHIFTKVLEGYKKNNPRAQAVLERLKAVQKRGRNKARD
jgi:TP53 regulating kinase and related kinases